MCFGFYLYFSGELSGKISRHRPPWPWWQWSLPEKNVEKRKNNNRFLCALTANIARKSSICRSVHRVPRILNTDTELRNEELTGKTRLMTAGVHSRPNSRRCGLLTVAVDEGKTRRSGETPHSSSCCSIPSRRRWNQVAGVQQGSDQEL